MRGEMTPDRWRLIEALCDEASDRTPSGRAAFLKAACNGDEELRSEVESLLRELEESPEFLERPVFGVRASGSAQTSDHVVGDSIGPYRLTAILGRGGMGEVYLAEREVADVKQRVAVKVIRRGLDSDEVLRRFRLERRILGNLHHPNIAQLIDASIAEDGRPYVVMEFVDGLPLVEYCDRERLGVDTRLQLMQTICGAVQHAHQHLVVHRDLKPRNILVSTDGAPKLLDFGIGKVLGPAPSLGTAVETAAELRLLTPEYAAPEQITGSQVTTATDVYALGILLFELLTGSHPYLRGDEDRSEMENAVVNTLPERPSARVAGMSEAAAMARGTGISQLRRRLSGDLDNIVLMALRKEPERRYASAAALAEDIQRHLDGLPVRARPDTLGYRTRKFVRRNAAAVIAVGAVFAALSATTAVTLVQSRRVAAAAAAAERERDKALEVRGFLMEMFGATGADQAVGDTVTARGLLDLQTAQVKTAYAGKPGLQADMLEVLADGYDRLGLYPEAEPLAIEALRIRREMLGASHPDVASALNMVGWIAHELGRSNQAESLLSQSADIRRAAGSRAEGDLSRSLNDLGVVYNALRRPAEAESVLREALSIRRRVFTDAHRAVGITANNLAAAFYFQRKVDSALVVQDLAVRSLQQAVGPEHQRTVVALNNLAAFKRMSGKLEESEADYRRLAALQTRLQGRDHPVTARVLYALGTVLVDRPESASSDSLSSEAEGLFREALAAFEKRLGPSHQQVGETLHRLSGVVLRRGRAAESMQLSRRAVSVLRSSTSDSSQVVRFASLRLAAAYEALGQQASADSIRSRFPTR